MFAYGTFYYSYMPDILRKEILSLNFTPCQDSPRMCSFPNASFSVNSKRNPFMTGQSYSISALFNMPDSPPNLSHGMFLSCLKVRTAKDGDAGGSCKSSTLDFTPSPLTWLKTQLHFSMGRKSNHKWLEVEFFEDYIDNPNFAADELILEIQSRFVEVTGVILVIKAQLLGVRFVMYNYPIASFFIGVFTSISIAIITLAISFVRIFAEDLKYTEDDFLTGQDVLKAKEVEEELEEDESDDLKTSSEDDTREYITQALLG